MGLLDRLNLLVRSNLNALTRGDDGAHDRHQRQSAGLSARQEMLQEVDATLQDARRQTAQLMRDERRIERDLRALNDDLQRWEDRAVKALEAGDEASARDALVVKHRLAARARHAEEELSAVRSYLSDLLRSMERLEGKRADLRAPAHQPQPQPPQTIQAPQPARLHAPSPRTTSGGFQETAARWESLTDARVRAQDPKLAAASAQTEPKTQTAFDAADASMAEFERVSSKIDAYEAQVEAEQDLRSLPLSPDDPLYDPKLADLEARFRALEAQQDPKQRRR